MAGRREKPAPAEPPFGQAVVDSVLERLQNVERELDLNLPEVFRCEGEELPLEREDVAEYRQAINSMTDVEALRIVAQRLLTAARTQRHLAMEQLRQHGDRVSDLVKRHIENEMREIRVMAEPVPPSPPRPKKVTWLTRLRGAMMARP